MYFDICSPLFEVKLLITELTTSKWKQTSAKAMKKSDSNSCLGWGDYFDQGPGAEGTGSVDAAREGGLWGRSSSSTKPGVDGAPRRPAWLGPPGPGGCDRSQVVGWWFSCWVVSDSCDPMDCGPLGSSLHGVLQARILEWVAVFFSKGSSWPRNWTQASCIADRWSGLVSSPCFRFSVKWVPACVVSCFSHVRLRSYGL